MCCNYSSTFLKEWASISPQPFLALNKISWVISQFIMFSYDSDFTHQLFSLRTFSTTIKIVSEFLPQKNEVKNAHHTQSHWLVALLFCDDVFFMLLLAKEHIFILYCDEQVTRTTFFTSYCEGANNNTYNSNILRSKELQYDNETQQSIFFLLLIARTMTTRILFMPYHNGCDDNYIFDVAKRPYCKGACDNNKPLWDARKQQLHLYMLSIVTMMGMCIFYFVLQGATMRNEGWLQRRSTRSCQPTTNQNFMLHWGSKQWLQNNNIIDVMIIFLCPMPYCKKLW
jgi:hypothetical protein